MTITDTYAHRDDNEEDEDGELTLEELEERKKRIDETEFFEEAGDHVGEQIESRKERQRELVDMKITIKEAERAGLGDDPAVEGLREQVNSLTDTDPEGDSAAGGIEALQAKRDWAADNGLEAMAAHYDDQMEGGEDGTHSGSEALSGGPGARAVGKVEQLRNTLSGDERDELGDLLFRVNFGHAYGGNELAQPQREALADFAADHGVDLSEIREQ
jgi:hypothetical protein